MTFINIFSSIYTQIHFWGVNTGEYIESHVVLERFTRLSQRHARVSLLYTALILSVSKIHYGKSVWCKNNWNHFPVRPLGVMGIMTHNVVLYSVQGNETQRCLLVKH